MFGLNSVLITVHTYAVNRSKHVTVLLLHEEITFQIFTNDISTPGCFFYFSGNEWCLQTRDGAPARSSIEMLPSVTCKPTSQNRILFHFTADLEVKVVLEHRVFFLVEWFSTHRAGHANESS